MLGEYAGQLTPPDKFADPIGYHLWYADNACPDCRGTGKYLPKSDRPNELLLARVADCETCQGKGVVPWMFDPAF